MTTHALDAENRLLQALAPAALAELGELELVHLSAQQVLHGPGTPVQYAYFPRSAVVSLVSTMQSGASTEVALVGRDGLVGLSGVLGVFESPMTAVVQVEGSGLRIPVSVLKAARARIASISDVLDVYTEALLIQTAQAAACNRLHALEARLARWLLAVHDRVGRDEFTITQEFMAQMLGTHGPAVATAMLRFQHAGLLEYRGRVLVLLNRAELETIACECYAVIRQEFDRLLPRVTRGSDTGPSVPVPPPPRAGRGREAAVEAMREIAGRLLVATLREQEAREEAEAASRAKDEFLATVSHELRTPLNAILGWCQMLTRDVSDERMSRGLDVIARNARAQLALVDDLLDTTRIQEGALTFNAALVNLALVVEHAVEAVLPVASSRGIQMGVQLENRAVRVIGDAERLQQVLLNLLTNALKFTGSGGRVDIQLETVGERARVIVRDTGRGILPELLPHVFDRFRQGQTAGHVGLGLGLTIAKTLVELHGGTIHVESPGEGKGTTCIVDLPAGADQNGGGAEAGLTNE